MMSNTEIDSVAVEAGVAPYTVDSSGQSILAPGNTTSSPVATAADDTHPCGVFFFVVYGPVFGTICVLGLLGNSLSFAVLTKFARRSVATYLLKAFAVTDNIFLATAAFIQMYPAMSIFFGLSDQLEPIYPYLQTYAWPVAHMVQMGTVWMMVLVATNRYIAVCKPFHAPRLCTKKKVQKQIVAMTVCIVIYNIPRFFEYRTVTHTVWNNSTNKSEEIDKQMGLVNYPAYNIIYENICYCLFVFFIPLVILVLENVQLVRELKKAQKSREMLASRTKREENNVTLVMVVIIIVFLVCQLPASVNQILYYLIEDAHDPNCPAYQKFYHLCNVFIITNSSVNFFIYCMFRKQFQQDLWSLCCLSKTEAARQKQKSPLSRMYSTASASYRPNRSATHSNSGMSRGSSRITRMNSNSTALESMPLKNNIVDSGASTPRNGIINNSTPRNLINAHHHHPQSNV